MAHAWAANPVFGVAVTVGLYALALGVRAKFRFAHPMLTTCAAVIALLALGHIPYDAYNQGGQVVTFFLAPATVALGVPIYRNASRIRREAGAIIAGIVCGVAVSYATAGWLVWALGGSRELLATMMPKSATTPISMEIVRLLGGNPQLGAVLTSLTGMFGSVLGPELLRAFGIGSDAAVGTAVGTASHGIGTARVLQDSEAAGSVSGFAMGIAGIVSSIAAVPLYWWMTG